MLFGGFNAFAGEFAHYALCEVATCWGAREGLFMRRRWCEGLRGLWGFGVLGAAVSCIFSFNYRWRRLAVCFAFGGVCAEPAIDDLLFIFFAYVDFLLAQSPKRRHIRAIQLNIWASTQGGLVK